ncbi:oxygen-dependent protoporphyrinogen oxidase [Sorochytrium milnesiophthora]
MPPPSSEEEPMYLASVIDMPSISELGPQRAHISKAFLGCIKMLDDEAKQRKRTSKNSYTPIQLPYTKDGHLAKWAKRYTRLLFLFRKQEVPGIWEVWACIVKDRIEDEQVGIELDIDFLSGFWHVDVVGYIRTVDLRGQELNDALLRRKPFHFFKLPQAATTQFYAGANSKNTEVRIPAQRQLSPPPEPSVRSLRKRPPPTPPPPKTKVRGNRKTPVPKKAAAHSNPVMNELEKTMREQRATNDRPAQQDQPFSVTVTPHSNLASSDADQKQDQASFGIDIPAVQRADEKTASPKKPARGANKATRGGRKGNTNGRTTTVDVDADDAETEDEKQPEEEEAGGEHEMEDSDGEHDAHAGLADLTHFEEAVAESDDHAKGLEASSQMMDEDKQVAAADTPWDDNISETAEADDSNTVNKDDQDILASLEDSQSQSQSNSGSSRSSSSNHNNSVLTIAPSALIDPTPAALAPDVGLAAVGKSIAAVITQLPLANRVNFSTVGSTTLTKTTTTKKVTAAAVSAATETLMSEVIATQEITDADFPMDTDDQEDKEDAESQLPSPSTTATKSRAAQGAVKGKKKSRPSLNSRFLKGRARAKRRAKGRASQTSSRSGSMETSGTGGDDGDEAAGDSNDMDVDDDAQAADHTAEEDGDTKADADANAEENIVVFGGGISGLSCAYFLARALSNTRIVVLEKSPRLGGWIHSVQQGTPGKHSDSTGGGLVLESGPRSLRPRGYAGAVTLRLIDELGCSNDLLTVPKTSSSAKKRYVWHHDRAALMPSSLSTLLSANVSSASPLHGILQQGLAEVFKSRRRHHADESVHSFISRRFSPALADELVSAVFHGIYAGDIRKLSIRSVMPLLPELEDRFGSVVLGGLLGSIMPSQRQAEEAAKLDALLASSSHSAQELWRSMQSVSIYSLKEGLGSLVDRLHAALQAMPNVQVMLEAKVQSASFSSNSAKMTLSDGGEITAEHVVMATPAPAFASLLRKSTNLSSSTVEQLCGLLQVPSVDVSVTNIAFPTNELSQSTRDLSDGFGLLAPLTRSPDVDPLLLGVIFDSSALPGQDASHDAFTKYTTMMGGHLFGSSASVPPPEELLARAVRAVRHHLAIPASVQPVIARSQLQTQCIPQYHVGHRRQMLQLRDAMVANLPAIVSVAGSWYGGGVGVNDCVKTSWELSQALVRRQSESISKPRHAGANARQHLSSLSALLSSRRPSAVHITEEKVQAKADGDHNQERKPHQPLATITKERESYGPIRRLKSFMFTVKHTSGESLPLLYPLYDSVRKVHCHSVLWDEQVVVRFLFKLDRAHQFRLVAEVAEDYIALFHAGHIRPHLTPRHSRDFYALWDLYVTALFRLNRYERAWEVVTRDLPRWDVEFTARMLFEVLTMLKQSGQEQRALQVFVDATKGAYVRPVDYTIATPLSSAQRPLFPGKAVLRRSLVTHEYQFVEKIFAVVLQCLFACGHIDEVLQLYKRMEPQIRNTVHLNTVMTGLLHCGHVEAVEDFYQRYAHQPNATTPTLLNRRGEAVAVPPDATTFAIRIQALLQREPPELGRAMDLLQQMSPSARAQSSAPDATLAVYTILIKHCIARNLTPLLMTVCRSMLTDGFTSPAPVTLALQHLQSETLEASGLSTSSELMLRLYNQYVAAGGRPDAGMLTIMAGDMNNSGAWIVQQLQHFRLPVDKQLGDILTRRGIKSGTESLASTALHSLNVSN